MQSTPSSSNYITPLRRTLGLSRRFKKSTPSTPNTLNTGTSNRITPNQRSSLNITDLKCETPFSESKIFIRNEGYIATPNVKNYKSPLKETTASYSSKRLNILSLKKTDKIKKKKLDFLDQENENNSNKCLPILSEFSLKENIILKSTSESCLSPDITSYSDINISNEEFANEMREIQLLKQKNIFKRLENGLKVKTEKLQSLPKSASDIFLNETLQISSLPPELGFHSAKVEAEFIDNKMQKKSHIENVTELKTLIETWRRGLRDSLEYLSCLSYPPANIEDILNHYNISNDWLKKED